MTYNGYENYQTWAVCSWLNQNGIDYQTAQIQYEELKEICKTPQELRIKFADWLKRQLNRQADYIRRQYQDTEFAYEQILVDLLNDSIEKINWYEVVDSLIEDSHE